MVFYRVLGMAGALDSARLEYFIAEALGCGAGDVSAMVLGGHGEAMLPLFSSASVKGVAVRDLLSAQQLEAIAARTAHAGAEIVDLLGSGSALYAPAVCVAAAVEAVLLDARRVVACSVLLRGEYGIQGVCLGVPVVLGAGGVVKVVDSISLDDAEASQLFKNAHVTREALRSLLGYPMAD